MAWHNIGLIFRHYARNVCMPMAGVGEWNLEGGCVAVCCSCVVGDRGGGTGVRRV